MLITYMWSLTFIVAKDFSHTGLPGVNVVGKRTGPSSTGLGQDRSRSTEPTRKH